MSDDLDQCHWMWTGGPDWDVDITKPPHNCPWPTQCIQPDITGNEFIGQQVTNDCREDPTP